MASYVFSNNTAVSPLSPLTLHHSLFLKCRLSIKNNLNLSHLSKSLKCKSAVVSGLTEPLLVEPYPSEESSKVLNDGNVINDRKHRPFWRRKWIPLDVLWLVLLCTVHLMFLYAPFCFSWHAVRVTIVTGLITGVLGIILSFHRHLSHKSFTIPKWLEYIFAYCGVLAFEGNPIDWVSTHRYHHKFADTERDPHSPKTEGFWFSYVSWLLDRHHLTSKCGEPNNVDDLRSQAFYRFIEKTYYFHPIGFGALLYAFGGLPILVWGLGVRSVIVLHITFIGTSVIHIWGEQAWNTGDSSRNNWWVALIGFGDGWHNNHHAFPYSAKAGLEWWQVDVTWGIIRLLEVLGLATDVKLPTEAHKKRMAWPTSMDNDLGLQS